MDLIAMESLAMDLNNRDDKKIKNRYGAVGHGFDRRLPLHRGQPLLPGFHPLPGPTTLLLDLLSWDPPLFLDRYGSHLTPPELRPFETLALRTYELDVHLSRLKTSTSPGGDDDGEEPAAGLPGPAGGGRGLLLGGGDEGEGAVAPLRPCRKVPGPGRERDGPAGGAVVGDADAAVGGGGDGGEDQEGATEARGREEGLDRRRGGGGGGRRRRTDGGFGFGFGFGLEFEFRLGIKPRTF